MQTKLTLRMDEALIRRAKVIAKRSGRSLSQMVADYFALLESQPGVPEDEHHTPITAKLRGLAQGKEVSVEDYRRHLEEKYQ